MAKKRVSSGVKLCYDYYTVRLPGDIYREDDPEAMEMMGQLAIETARERARIYCSPALWLAECVKGELGDHTMTFRVRRSRRKAS